MTLEQRVRNLERLRPNPEGFFNGKEFLILEERGGRDYYQDGEEWHEFIEEEWKDKDVLVIRIMGGSPDN